MRCRGPEFWRRDSFGEDLLAVLVEVVREPVAGHLGALPVRFRRQRADCSRSSVAAVSIAVSHQSSAALTRCSSAR